MDCGEGKLGYSLTGDPEIDAETKRIHQERLKERQERRMAQYMKESQEKHAVTRRTWQGTSLINMDPKETQLITAATPLLAYFQNDPPAPEERTKWFAEFTDPNGKILVKGWRVLIKSVKQDGDNWLIDVEVYASLVGETPKVVFTDRTTIEQWRLSSDGTFTCVSCLPGNLGVLGEF